MRSPLVVPVGVAGIILLLGFARACGGGKPSAANPECPHEWDFSRINIRAQREKTYVPLQTLSGNVHILSGPRLNTNVPEFHDCQRLVRGEGSGATYDSLVAVFASDTMSDSTIDLPPFVTPGSRMLIPLVEVASWGGTYEDLNIQPGFNCLYVSPTDTPIAPLAIMVPFGEKERDCHAPKSLEALQQMSGASPLSIRLTRYPRLTWVDYPPVARWDWDTVGHTQVIGFKCLDAWCEVGRRKALVQTADNLITRMGAATAANLIALVGDPLLERVLTVKGWYDEQRLAPPHGAWLVGAPQPMPLEITGVLLPVASLSNLTAASFKTTWNPVAMVLLSAPSVEYQKKFNYQPMSPDGRRVTTIELCMEESGGPRCSKVPSGARTAAKCGPETGTNPPRFWWARTRATDGSERYWCIVRRGHTGPDDVPGVTRWRWLAGDETSWARCDRGCCTGQ